MATFIRHKNSVERIMPAALPPGCRIGQQFDLKYKKLYDGDMVIMVSDGMLEFENMPEISFRMESLIGKIKTNNAQVFANELIEAVPVLEDGYDDDPNGAGSCYLGERNTKMWDKHWERVDSFLKKWKMVQEGDSILLGISGGADSVCLARYFLARRRGSFFKIVRSTY